ncbi:MAG: hypothetical protein WKG07_10310 [Hymenobacter sp.]
MARNRASWPRCSSMPCRKCLEPLGLALVLLTLDSDAYPLSVVADASGRRSPADLAQELGFDADSLLTPTPSAGARPRR